MLLTGLFASPLWALERHAYARIQGWEVHALRSAGDHKGCVMRRAGAARDFGLARQHGSWALLIGAAGADGTPVHLVLRVDMGSADLRGQIRAGEAQLPLAHSVVQALAQGQDMQLQLGTLHSQHGLQGSAAAIQKVTQCDDAQGQTHRSAPRSTTAAPPAPSPAGQAPLLTQEARLHMGRACPVLGAMASPHSTDWGEASFVNLSGQAVTLFWLDGAGHPQEMLALPPGGEAELTANAGHLFLAKDAARQCRGGVITLPYGRSRHEIR
jgi:hypothetical protein